jgi:hypothetical protein
MSEEKNCWKILKLLSKLAQPNKIEYEIEHKDGLPFKVKNLKIEEICLEEKIDFIKEILPD